MYGELKNVLPSPVKKTHLPVRGRKVAHYIGGGMGSKMKKCKISCTPITMVPCLHYSNGYIIGKLRVWRAQKCTALVGAENPLTSAWPKSSPLHGERYGIDNEKMQNFVHPNHYGTVFALKQWLHHREATCMESSKMYCPRRCRKPTYQCWANK